MSRSLFCRLLVLGGVLLFLPPVGVLAQEPAEEQPNELVAGRLIYVNRMPGELDRWIVDFLRRWGKYTVTGDPEGVDLVWDAHRAGTEVRYRLDRRRGLPLDQLQKAAGHKDPRSTEIYAELAQEQASQVLRLAQLNQLIERILLTLVPVFTLFVGRNTQEPLLRRRV